MKKLGTLFRIFASGPSFLVAVLVVLLLMVVMTVAGKKGTAGTILGSS
jgi:hypothetical protein